MLFQARSESVRPCSLSVCRDYFSDLVLHDGLDVSAVHSLAGFNLADDSITGAPYSDPHHSASVASIA